MILLFWLNITCIMCRFHKVLWGSFGSDIERSGLQSGVVVAGADDGTVLMYDAQKMIAENSECLLAQLKKHVGAVKALDFNPFQTNLLASGGAESEIFIWDLNKPDSPMTPGQKSQVGFCIKLFFEQLCINTFTNTHPTRIILSKCSSSICKEYACTDNGRIVPLKDVIKGLNDHNVNGRLPCLSVNYKATFMNKNKPLNVKCKSMFFLISQFQIKQYFCDRTIRSGQHCKDVRFCDRTSKSRQHCKVVLFLQPPEEVACVAWNRQVQHILASNFTGRCVVWDLRKNEPIIKVSDSMSRVRSFLSADSLNSLFLVLSCCWRINQCKVITFQKAI